MKWKSILTVCLTGIVAASLLAGCGNDKADKKADKKFERQQLIIEYLQREESVSNREARAILGLAESTTKRILKQMVQDEILSESGQRKGKRYFLKKK